MASSTIQSFSNMPIDLVRDVFEFAASDRQCALNLTLVSSAVRMWTLPILYNNVRLSSSHAVTKFLNAITPSSTALQDLAPYTPLHRRVKNLGIFALGPLDSIHHILATCTEVQSLACGFSLTHAPPPAHAREQHLTGMSCRDGIPFHAIPIDTTHLHVQLPLDAFPSLIDIHDRLPNLGHLVVSVPMTSVKPLGLTLPALQRILDNSPRLLALRLQVMGSKGGEVAAAANSEWQKRDTRLSIIKAPGSLSRQWAESPAFWT